MANFGIEKKESMAKSIKKPSLVSDKEKKSSLASRPASEHLPRFNVN